MQRFPKMFIDVAKYHGSKRESSNSEVRQTNSEYVVTNPDFIDFIGVLGEMIAAFEMMKQGRAFFLNDLFGFEKASVPGADIITKKNDFLYNIDVKATTTDFARVPKFKLLKAKESGITHYWFVKIILEQCLYSSYFCSVEDVAGWNVVEYFGRPNFENKIS